MRVDGTRLKQDEAEASTDLDIEESVRFRRSGFVLDPRIGNFSLELEPVFSQGISRGPGRTENVNGQSLNFSANVNVLQGTPGLWGGSAFASRSSGTTTGDLGSRTDFVSESRGATLNLKSRYFPSALSYSERHSDRSFRSGFTRVTSERDDTTRSLAFRGRSSKMNVLLDRTWLDARSRTTERESVTDTARLNHVFRWGKGSQLGSRNEYFRRTGFRAQERLSTTKSAHLQHTETLSTDYTYGFLRSRQVTDTVRHRGTFGLRHRLYRNLSTNLRLAATLTDAEVTEQEQYSANLNLDYRKGIFWGGTLRAGIGGGYRLTDRRSTGDLLEVLDESHVVPQIRIVLLNRRFIDPSTIVVTDIDGTAIFELGRDYTIAAVANNFTELTILVGGEIEAGDTILVSYKFESLPTARFTTIPLNYRLELGFGWITLFHRASRTESSLISGVADGFLTDEERSSTGVRVHWTWGRTRARGSAEIRSRRSGEFESDSIHFNQSLSHRFSRTLSASVVAGQAFSESSNRQTDLYSLGLTAGWSPWHNLRLSGGASGWLRRDRGASLLQGGDRDESFMRAYVDLSWFWRKVEVNLRYEHHRREFDESQSDEDRIMLVLIRRSF